MFQFGNPNLFAQGVVEQTLYDPATGNVVGYDRLASDVAVNYTFDFSEIAAGFQNQLVGLIPHTTRMSGTYTSAAFSLEARALLSGGTAQYGAIAPVCETITATEIGGDQYGLRVSKTPSRSYAQDATDPYCWCQVREHGVSTYSGQNYGVDPTTKVVQGFAPVSGKEYDVFYFTVLAQARSLGMSAAADPSAVTVQQKWGIYASQNGNKKSGTLQGFLYVIVPLAILEGDGGINGNQTTNATTSYNWRAITSNDNIPSCNSCERNDNNYAYYVYVPCGNGANNEIVGMYVVGGTIELSGVTPRVQVPLRYEMNDGTTVLVTDYLDIGMTVISNTMVDRDSSAILPLFDNASGILSVQDSIDNGTATVRFYVSNTDIETQVIITG